MAVLQSKGVFMKKFFGFVFNAVLSVILGIFAVYLISFLNIVPHSMQVDLPHYMYPTVMPASGTTASDAQKARDHIAKKLHKELVDLGIEEEETVESYVPSDTDKVESSFSPYSYPKYAKPLGYSIVQQGYFTPGGEGKSDRFFSPGPDGVWYSYDPDTKALVKTPEAAAIPCSYEDLITFYISRDASAVISSDMEEILSESECAEDLAQIAKTAVRCFGPGSMKGEDFASLLQYQAAGLFLGFTDETMTNDNRGMACYLSGSDRKTLNQVSYNTKYAEFHNKSAELEPDTEVISTVIDGYLYTYDSETRMITKIAFWSDEKDDGLWHEKVAALPENYMGPPVVGKAGKTLCCVFAGESSVQMMDLKNRDIRIIPELAPEKGESFEQVSFVFGTDRLVIFYTTAAEPEKLRVSEVLYSNLEG